MTKRSYQSTNVGFTLHHITCYDIWVDTYKLSYLIITMGSYLFLLGRYGRDDTEDTGRAG